MSARVTKALIFVTDAFKDINRKGSRIPYVAHLVGTMELVARYGGTNDEMIAALLHDYLEDIEGSEPWEIEDLFGTAVCKTVLSLTDGRAGRKGPWHERKRAYLKELARASPSAKLVCAADKIHNVRSIIDDYAVIGNAVWEKFKVNKEETLWYYLHVVATLSGSHPIVDELVKVVDELEEIVDGKNDHNVEGHGGKPRGVSALG